MTTAAELFEVARRVPAATAWTAMGKPIARRQRDRVLAHCIRTQNHRQGDVSPSLNLGIGDGTLGNGAVCFSCGFKADSIALVSEVLGLDLIDAARWLAERYGHLSPSVEYKAPAPPPAVAPDPFDATAISNALAKSPRAKFFLSFRRLLRVAGDGARLQALGVGVVDDFVAFGYHAASGEPVKNTLYHKLRNYEEDKEKRTLFLRPKCAMQFQPLYLGRFVTDGPVVITEGEIDALTFRLCLGFENAVSLPQGVGSARHVDLSPLLQAPIVYIATDNDGPGDDAATVLSARLYLDGVAECRRLTFRRAVSRGQDLWKDANDAVRKGEFTAEELTGLLATAPVMPRQAPVTEPGVIVGIVEEESGPDPDPVEEPAVAPNDEGLNGLFDDEVGDDFVPPPAEEPPIAPRPTLFLASPPRGNGIAATLGTDLIPPELEVPEGYVVRPDGVLVKPTNETDTATGAAIFAVVMQSIVVPVALYKEIDSEKEWVELAYAWGAARTWRTSVVARSAIASSRECIKLSVDGIPVHENNGKGCVVWLNRFIDHNTKHLRHNSLAHRCGWFEEDGDARFVLGETVYSAGAATKLRVHLGHGGEQNISRAMKPHGSRDEQVALLRMALKQKNPAALMLLAGIASPLYRWINPEQNGFFIHCWTTTSQGKSAALKLAASVYGAPSAFVVDWSGTPFSQQVIASMLSSLPLCLDEFQARDDRDKKARTEALYQISNGKGRTQGDVEGNLRAVRTWFLIGLSNGERPASDVSPDPGLKARIIELALPPFGAAATGDEVGRIVRTASEHRGWVGHDWIRWLVENLGPNRALWASMQSQAASDMLELLRLDGHTHELAHRWAAYLACIDVAAALLNQSGILGEPIHEMHALAPWALAQMCGIEESRPGEEDAHWLQTWIIDNLSQFDLTSVHVVPSGRPVLGYRLSTCRIGVSPNALRQELSKRNVSMKAFLDRLTKVGIYEGNIRAEILHVGRPRVHAFSFDPNDMNVPITPESREPQK